MSCNKDTENLQETKNGATVPETTSQKADHVQKASQKTIVAPCPLCGTKIKLKYSGRTQQNGKDKLSYVGECKKCEMEVGVNYYDQIPKLNLA